MSRTAITTRATSRTNDQVCDIDVRYLHAARLTTLSVREGGAAQNDQVNVNSLFAFGAEAIAQMSQLQNPAIVEGTTPHDDAYKAFCAAGDAMYRLALGTPRDRQLKRYADIWKEVLDRNYASGRPTIVHLRGGAGSIPWEFIRLPADISPSRQVAWLGEFCVFCVIPEGIDEAQLTLDDANFTGAAIYGEKRAFLAKQREFLTSLVDGERQLFQTPNPLDKGTIDEIALVKANADKLAAFFSAASSLHCLTVAAHSQPLKGERAKEIHRARADWIDRDTPVCHMFFETGCEITDVDFVIAGGSISELFFAFLNTCRSFVMEPGDAKVYGLAGSLLHDLNAQRVVAAMCEVNSEGAHVFAEALFRRWLPSQWGQGAELGRAVFEARQATAAQGFLTGLCYRIVGRHDFALAPFQGSARWGEDVETENPAKVAAD